MKITSYISQTWYGKLFWTAVVVLGFTGAFVLINNSYSAWQDSPIATTISTHPLASLDFPNVTVCPPNITFQTANTKIMNKLFTPMTLEEKIELGFQLMNLSSEDLSKVVHILHVVCVVL